MAWQDIFAASEWGNYFRQQGPLYSSFGHRGTDLKAGDGKTLVAWERLTVIDSDAYMESLGFCINLRADDGKVFGVAHTRRGTRAENGAVLNPGDKIAEAARGANYGADDFPGSAWDGAHYHIVLSDSPNAAFGQGNLENARPRILAAVGGSAPQAGYGFGLTEAAQLAAQKALKKLGLYAGMDDGDFGPLSVSAFQQHLKNIGLLPVDYRVDGVPGPIYGAAVQTLAARFGYKGPKDGAPGEATSAAIERWGASILDAKPPVETPKPVVPKPPVPAPDPDMVTPVAADFPSWIQYEEVLDPDGQRPDLLEWALDYYDAPYFPVESHTHWWGTPGESGTHDSNVAHLKATASLSANYVVSENRVTLMVPLDLIALTTGRRNPDAWKTENDPSLTEQHYKTLGFLHYLVELKNPRLAGEQIRLHKEFYASECSAIDVAKVRYYAGQFASGQLDPETGEPAVTPEKPVPENPGPEEPTVPEKPEPEKPTYPVQPMPEEATQVALSGVQVFWSILPRWARDWLFAIYGIAGAVLMGMGQAMVAMQVLAPQWYVGAMGFYVALAPFVALIAKANLTPKSIEAKQEK